MELNEGRGVNALRLDMKISKHFFVLNEFNLFLQTLSVDDLDAQSTAKSRSLSFSKHDTRATKSTTDLTKGKWEYLRFSIS